MPTLDATLVADLTHADGLTFERGVEHYRAWRASANDEQALQSLIEILTTLGASSSLGPSELTRRARLLLDGSPLSESVLPALATASKGFTPEIRNAVVASLPAASRRLVFQRDTSVSRTASPARSPSSLPPVPPPVRARGNTEPAAIPTVLLLGSQQDHEDNHTLLQTKECTPLGVRRTEDLDNLLTADVCGIVIAKSWWTLLSLDDHRAFLTKICRYSSFAWIKIDVTGLTCGEALPEIQRINRYEDPASHEFSHGAGCQLTTVDVACIKRAFGLLSAASDAQLYPSEIHEPEARVLLAAAAKHVQGRNFPGPVQMRKLGAATIHGGRSFAQIVRLEPDDGGIPLVAKIGPVEYLDDEMRRFRQFIEPWDAVLKPRLHFHAKTGAIVFSLVDTPESPGAPAPTLEDRMFRLLSSEQRTDQDAEAPQEANIRQAMEWGIQKLEGLNGKTCTTTGIESFAWLGLDSPEAMNKRGINWNIQNLQGKPVDILVLGRRAAQTVQPLAISAVVHGDVHLRNVLLRHDREPHFIDYAYSGPGHPCFDLVRCETAMMFQCFRMISDERRVAELICLIANGCAADAEITRQFPELMSSAGNRLAIKTSVLARAAALRVLGKHGGKVVVHSLKPA